jgi:Kef-type K+ transport system membrane component KefB
MKKILVVYSCVVIVCGLAIYSILEHGRQAQGSRGAVHSIASQVAAPSVSGGAASPSKGPAAGWLTRSLVDNLKDPLSLLFIQLIVIVLAARVVGSLFTRIGQPAVVGEMATGILLGPSLLGLLLPEVSSFIFPAPTLGSLRLFSQIGVCLFLFGVGMELDPKHLRHRAQTAVLVSHASILIPYMLGVAMSVFLFHEMAAPGADFVSFALFMGISMSITAFPVLARILKERGLTQTFLGTTATTCAAIDDVTAWSILAFVVAIVKAGSLASAGLSIALLLAFIASILWWVKPRLAGWLGPAANNEAELDKSVIAGVMILILTSALCTEIIGVHALFGAFLAGVIIPRRSHLLAGLQVRLEHLSSTFLLPVFFAFTGLRTQVGLINDAGSWLLCGGIILVATLGKLGGSMLAARLTGIGWNESFALGALMNTRGLMELIALNLGFDLGILSPRIFTMLVLMALVTTFLTSPLLALSEAWKTRRALSPEPACSQG